MAPAWGIRASLGIALACSQYIFFYMTSILSILYDNLNAVGQLHLNAEYNGINCLNISLGGWSQ